MSDKYTQEDKDAFARKDKLIVAQSSIKAAVEFFAGKDVRQEAVLDTAEMFFNWVFELVDGEDSTKVQSNISGIGIRSTEDSVPPIPTLKQKEWLDKITAKYGFTMENIWSKCKKFPSDSNSAIEITKIMKG